jgi:HEAT repeat protein
MHSFCGRLRGVIATASLAIACLSCNLRPAAAADATAPQDAVQMTVDFLAKDDQDFRAIGLDRVRYGLKGEAATMQFAGLLSKLAPARQLELTAALADRGDRAALPALLALLLASKEPAIRAAVINAVGSLGSGTEVAVLKSSLAAAEPEKAAARRALTVLRGNDVTAQIAEGATSGEPGLRPTFIDILADRRAVTALPELLTAAVDGDPAIRTAAMRALARFGGPEQVAGMVQGVLKAAAGGERDEAERALVTVCTQNPGKERSAEVLLEQFTAANDATKETLLTVLARVGGNGVIAIVDGLIADANAGKRKLGLAALAKWPDATVSQRLLDLLGKSQDPAERELLLGTLIRIAPLPDNKLNDKQKLELLQKTMTLCQRDEDRRRVLERANAIRTIETLRFVVPYLDDPNLAEPACLSVVELAHHRTIRDANKDEFTKALDKVQGTTKNEELIERAERYKQGQTWERKKPAKS